MSSAAAGARPKRSWATANASARGRSSHSGITSRPRRVPRVVSRTSRALARTVASRALEAVADHVEGARRVEHRHQAQDPLHRPGELVLQGRRQERPGVEAPRRAAGTRAPGPRGPGAPRGPRGPRPPPPPPPPPGRCAARAGRGGSARGPGTRRCAPPRPGRRGGPGRSPGPRGSPGAPGPSAPPGAPARPRRRCPGPWPGCARCPRRSAPGRAPSPGPGAGSASL